MPCDIVGCNFLHGQIKTQIFMLNICKVKIKGLYLYY